MLLLLVGKVIRGTLRGQRKRKFVFRGRIHRHCRQEPYLSKLRALGSSESLCWGADSCLRRKLWVRADVREILCGLPGCVVFSRTLQSTRRGSKGQQGTVCMERMKSVTSESRQVFAGVGFASTVNWWWLESKSCSVDQVSLRSEAGPLLCNDDFQY